MLNSVCINGRLVKDCQLEQAGKDTVKTRFTLAVNRDYKDRDGNTPCDFLDCEVWNAGANFLENYARKGDMISVAGSLRRDTWKDKDGNYQSRVYISAASVNTVAQRRDAEEEEEEEEKPSRKSSRRR